MEQVILDHLYFDQSILSLWGKLPNPYFQDGNNLMILNHPIYLEQKQGSSDVYYIIFNGYDERIFLKIDRYGEPYEIGTTYKGLMNGKSIRRESKDVFIVGFWDNGVIMEETTYFDNGSWEQQIRKDEAVLVKEFDKYGNLLKSYILPIDD